MPRWHWYPCSPPPVAPGSRGCNDENPAEPPTPAGPATPRAAATSAPHAPAGALMRGAPPYSAIPCTRIWTRFPGCTLRPAATQLPAVAPCRCWNGTCCPVVTLVHPPLLGTTPTTAPPTSVAPLMTGPLLCMVT